jgi:hypothetical protein
MFLFEMRSRLRLAFLFNCLEMEAQAHTRSTTSEQEKKAWWLSLRGIFSSTRKSSYLFVLFSAAVGKGGLSEGVVDCSMGKDDFCIPCR